MRRFVGCALALFCCGYSWAAQESQRVTKPPPAVEQRAASQPGGAQYPTEATPLPIRIVEPTTDAQRREQREAAADKHDADDLDAQVRSANAAEKQVLVNWSALALSLVGAVFLALTLLETRKAAQAAIESAKWARETADAAKQSAQSVVTLERAYLFVAVQTPTRLRHSEEGGKNTIKLTISNLGNTPANVVRIDCALLIGDAPPDTLPEARDKDGLVVPIGIPKGGSHEHGTLYRLTTSNLQKLIDRKTRAFFIGVIGYSDLFSNGYSTGFCVEMKAEADTIVSIAPLRSALNNRT